MSLANRRRGFTLGSANQVEIMALRAFQILAFCFHEMYVLLRFGALRTVDEVVFLFEVVQRIGMVSFSVFINRRVLLPSSEEV